MNFKEEYGRAFSDVKADEDLKKSLVEAMEDQSSNKKKWKFQYAGVAVAAALVLVTVGLYFGGVGTKGEFDSAETDMVQMEAESNVFIEFESGVMANPGDVGSYSEIDLSGIAGEEKRPTAFARGMYEVMKSAKEF